MLLWPAILAALAVHGSTGQRKEHSGGTHHAQVNQPRGLSGRLLHKRARHSDAQHVSKAPTARGVAMLGGVSAVAFLAGAASERLVGVRHVVEMAGSSSGVNGMLKSFDMALVNHALPTKAATTAFTFGLGNFLEQSMSRGARDVGGVLRMCMFGALFDAPLQHMWHNVLERFLPGTTFRSVFQKIAADQTLMAPLQLSVFLTVLSVATGGTVLAGLRRVHGALWSVFRVHTAFWCAAHVITFRWIPLEYRTVWSAANNICYTALLSYITRSTEPRRDDDSQCAIQWSPPPIEADSTRTATHDELTLSLAERA